MTKKCEVCKSPIDVHQGGYVNVYTVAFEMHSCHTICYRNMILESWSRENKNLERWGQLQ